MGCLHTATMSAPADGPPGAPTTGRPLTPAPHLSTETSGIYPGGGWTRGPRSVRHVKRLLLLGAEGPRDRSLSLSLPGELLAPSPVLRGAKRRDDN